MFRIIEKYVNILPSQNGEFFAHLAQIPCSLKVKDFYWKIEDPEHHWDCMKSILQIVSQCEKGKDFLNFVIFPEASVPHLFLKDFIEFVKKDLRRNTIVIAGIEHISLYEYKNLLEEFAIDNCEALTEVRRDAESEEKEKPVNCCMIIVKEVNDNFHIFFEAKTHPFRGEEHISHFIDLYRGKHIYLFRSEQYSFNFIVLLCFDYVYRDLRYSNIRAIIERANNLFFDERQDLDLLIIIQNNPKPEHKAFIDTVAGFYGEFLSYNPGVRNALTIFLNTSGEVYPEESNLYGYSSVCFNERFKLRDINTAEYSTDDFYGGRVCRVRFGRNTRLYILKLILEHEIDPRTARIPIRVIDIYKQEDRRWRKMLVDEIIYGKR